MPSGQDFTKFLGDSFDLLTRTQVSSELLFVALCLLLAHLVLVKKLADSKPKDLSAPVKILSVATLVTSSLFALGGAAIAMMDLYNNPIKPLSSQKRLSNLAENTKTEWVIRLIPYTPNLEHDKDKLINNLKTIGPPGVDYTFVNAYDELKGLTVAEAVSQAGISKAPGQHVSAVIFPVSNSIYPANARGLLQVLSDIKRTESSAISKIEGAVSPLGEGSAVNRAFTNSIHLNDEEIDDLRNTDDLDSWAFKSYGKFYPHYCRLSHRFRCDKGVKYIEKSYISLIQRDWHPSGGAIENGRDLCQGGDSYCDVSSWDQIVAQLGEKFGVRVFLIPNFEVSALSTRYMIDFSDPEKQKIPDILPLVK